MINLLRLIICLPSLTLFISGCGEGAGGTNTNGSGGSVGGSTATMVEYQDILYTLIDNQLVLIDLNTMKPVSTDVGFGNSNIRLFGAEALHLYNNYLYVAGSLDIQIFDLMEPTAPKFVGRYVHATACDPVIVDDNIGYVTLRNRANCGGAINRLEIVDFSDPTAPVQITEYPMSNPHGLAKTPNFLGVCQEYFGLTLLDVADPSDIRTVNHYTEYNCFDLIYHRETLYMTATDGIYQFYAAGNELVEISRIPVGFSDNPSP